MPSDPAVILTQEQADCERLSQLLIEHGINSLAYPCIATMMLPYSGSDLLCGHKLEDFKVVAFTSKRGVAGMLSVRQRLLEMQPIIACVGDTTASNVKSKLGLDCRIIPLEHTSGGLAQAILENLGKPEMVLHPRGSKSSGEFKQTLEMQGWKVCEVVVYENFAPPSVPLDSKVKFSLAVFASPSAAKRFFWTNPDLLANITCIAIGPTTRQSLQQLGATQIIESAQPTLEGLVDTIKLKLTQGINK